MGGFASWGTNGISFWFRKYSTVRSTVSGCHVSITIKNIPHNKANGAQISAEVGFLREWLEREREQGPGNREQGTGNREQGREERGKAPSWGMGGGGSW